ncbi:hypothetical protein TDB9533_00720 [Thalassocella blandensis]|nr:hypothetical protein TDB9533_00720 [Thalassocella blandensis]
MQTGQIPKKIWMYWHQGEQNAPLLVKKCLASWRLKNPDWEIELLDADKAKALVDLGEFDRRDDIGLQMLSDILRIKLLMAHGGVWADASLFCIKPLDEWLPNHVQNGFFAFACKRRDRVMTNWFLASTHDSEFLRAWGDSVLQYWLANSFRKPGFWTRQLQRKFMSLRKRHIISNEFWFSAFVTKVLKIHPYPINMYMFEKVLNETPELKAQWPGRNALYDELAEKLQNNLGINALATDTSKRFLEEMSTPVHKLNWRQDIGEVKPASNFEYLLTLAEIK